MLAVVPPPVTVRAPAKINLHLGVGRARQDGFHELSTVFQALSLTDEVTVLGEGAPGVEVHAENVPGSSGVPTDGSNLAWRAVEALARHAGREPKVRVVLRKSIPVAGGMAGGSSDAAATLLALSALWGMELGREQLAELAAELGSDVPFFLHGGTALGTGRGTDLVPVLTRHTFHWVLGIDSGGLPTPKVFCELDRLRERGTDRAPEPVGPAETVLEGLAYGDPNQLALLLGNDLQAAAISLRPTLRRTLRAGVSAGALAGLVSGSGPTCAFLCRDEADAAEVASRLAGEGVCHAVRVAHGPVPGVRVARGPDNEPPPEQHPPPPEVHA